jgi:transcriptional repressor NrdR
LKCGERFTTYEKVELELAVVKKDGRKEQYSREKLKSGILKAFHKRLLDSEGIEKLINEIEAKIFRSAKEKEISSEKIGQIIMERLKKADKVAYIRFASVYREFADIDDFKDAIKEVK